MQKKADLRKSNRILLGIKVLTTLVIKANHRVKLMKIIDYKKFLAQANKPLLVQIIIMS